MDSLIAEYGIPGIIIFLLYQEIMRLRGSKRGTSCGVSREDFMVVKDQVKELHDWHAREDEDGVKVWYVRRSLEHAIEKLASAITQQANVLTEIKNIIKQQGRKD